MALKRELKFDQLLSPLVVGEPAIIRVGGTTLKTSAVVDFMQTNYDITIKTKNSVYRCYNV